MRLIKMLGLAAFAAVAAMAFVGASSAVANLADVVLCKLNVEPCPAGEHFGVGTVLHGSLVAGTKAVLLSDLGNVECSTSTTLGIQTSLLAHGEITALAFGSCKLGETACTVTVEHLNYLAETLLNDTHNGYHVVVLEKAPNGRPQARVKCGSIIDCTFGSPSVLLTVESNASDVVLSVLQELERGLPGLTCPALTSVWHAKYLTQCLDASGAPVGCWPRMHAVLSK